MKKTVISIISLCVLTTLPFLSFNLACKNIKPRYGNTFLAELPEKVELLKNTTGKKIIFIGGSSLPFGLRSDLINEELEGYTSINFGLYATLGTKLMIELSKANIQKDDIVILAPELDEQTYSLYFNPEATLEAFEGHSYLRKYLSYSEKESLYYNSYAYNFTRIRESKNGPIQSSQPYSKDSFNEYGEIDIELNENILPEYYLGYQNVNDLLNKDFIKYINNYASYVKKKGANIYFSFSPINTLSLQNSDEEIENFENQLQEKLKFDLLGHVNDFKYNENYFYDTNFHLNSVGKILHTSNLVNLLKEKLDINTPTNIVIPDMPTRSPSINIEGLENDVSCIDYFSYSKKENGRDENNNVIYSYSISSIKNEYINEEKIIIPSIKDNLVIDSIENNAFENMINLKEIVISNSIRAIGESCFNGCKNLENIILLEENPNKLLVPLNKALLTGCNNGVKIMVPEESVNKYRSNYSWYGYRDYISGYKKG